MSDLRRSIRCGAVFALLLVAAVAADEYPPQEMITLPVKVVDEDGKPVAGVKLIPWALRCSQGHGQWHEETLGNCPEFATDSSGRADITYPYYTQPGEFIRTTEVTLSVDHKEYVYVSHEDVNVPREEAEPHLITVARGGDLEVTPFINGAPAGQNGLRAMWTDNRSRTHGAESLWNTKGCMVISAMAPGPGQVMAVKLAEGHATHFSPIIDLQVEARRTLNIEAELKPAVQITGRFSDDVPRPIENGRVVAWTLAENTSGRKVYWRDWVEVAEDGSFVIERWPSSEPIQITALCDGYIAASGEPPAVVDDRQRRSTAFQRPQVFDPAAFAESLVVQMEPLVECRVDITDEHGKPITGAAVWSCPNVGWWNGGSQIYCGYLNSTEDFLVSGNREAVFGDWLSGPWVVKTDDMGSAVLWLPAGNESLYVDHDEYELAINQGDRRVRVELTAGLQTHAQLVLQAKGQEFLGEWDKLAGVLFGCTGEECRRLLDDPGFRKRITAVRVQLDEAEKMNDPNLLKNAFAEISAAFDEVGDQEEVARWRRKADEQAAKLKAD